MKIFSCSMVLAILVSASVVDALPDETGSAVPAPVSSSELKVGTGIENKEPTGVSESFSIAPDTKIYVWAKVRDVAAGSSITLVFLRGDVERFRKELSVPSVPYRTNAFRTMRKGDGGEWNAKLLGPDGAELASTRFTVTIE